MGTCKKVESGEWVQPRRKNYFVECCDCGLIHRLNFRLLKHGKGKKIQFQAFRSTPKAAKAAIKAAKQ